MNPFAIASIALPLVFASHSSVASSTGSSAASQQSRAVVLVSGGGLRTPFTTPTQACKDGDGFQAAGSTKTALRKYLLERGKQVYTAPTMDNWGPVTEPRRDSIGPFTGCPDQLPESMTILSTGDWNAGGERLARFLGYLNTRYGVTDVDLVGHSNGGVWSRAAIKVLKDTNSTIRVRSLTRSRHRIPARRHRASTRERSIWPPAQVTPTARSPSRDGLNLSTPWTRD